MNYDDYGEYKVVWDGLSYKLTKVDEFGIPIERDSKKEGGHKPHVHVWKLYQGLIEEYDYCEDCDEKRPTKD